MSTPLLPPPLYEKHFITRSSIPHPAKILSPFQSLKLQHRNFSNDASAELYLRVSSASSRDGGGGGGGNEISAFLFLVAPSSLLSFSDLLTAAFVNSVAALPAIFDTSVLEGSAAFPWLSFLLFSIGGEEEEEEAEEGFGGETWGAEEEENREDCEGLGWPIWKLAPEGLHGGVNIVGSVFELVTAVSEEKEF